MPTQRHWPTLLGLTAFLLPTLYLLVNLVIAAGALMLARAGVRLSPEPPVFQAPQSQLIMDFTLFTLVCFSLWCSTFILYGLYAWFWEVAGQERILLDPTTLQLQKRIWGWTFAQRAYARTDVRDLRVPPTPTANFIASLLRFTPTLKGRIAFDYGAQTVYFGQDLDEAEAKQITATLRAYGNTP